MFTKDEILKQLKALCPEVSPVTLLHSSLRAVGKVEGGAEALLDTLIEYFTRNGSLLCVPTHTWDNLEKPEVCTLDMTKQESNLGTFSLIAAKDPRGIRSENPTHSMMVFGDRQKAEEFIRAEAFVKTPTAPDSCYGKLYKMGGKILLLGVAQDKNTYLHTVAEMLNIENRMAKTPTKVSVKLQNGEVKNRELYLFDCSYTDDISLLFPKYNTAFRYHGAVDYGFIGRAPSEICDDVKLYDTVKLIFERSGGKDPLEYPDAIPQLWYCE